MYTSTKENEEHREHDFVAVLFDPASMHKAQVLEKASAVPTYHIERTVSSYFFRQHSFDPSV